MCLKNFIKNHPGSFFIGVCAIVAAIVGPVISHFFGWINLLDILNSVIYVLKWFFNFELKFWYLLCFGLLLFFILKIRKSKNTDENIKVDPPKFLDYTEDVFEDVTWRWEIRESTNNRGKPCVYNLTPLCEDLECKTPCEYKKNYRGVLSVKCPRCGVYNHILKNKQEVESLILDNIKRNKYNAI